MKPGERPTAAAAPTDPQPDPAAPLLEALDRLRVTGDDHSADSETARLRRGLRTYQRQAGEGSSGSRQAVRLPTPPSADGQAGAATAAPGSDDGLMATDDPAAPAEPSSEPPPAGLA